MQMRLIYGCLGFLVLMTLGLSVVLIGAPPSAEHYLHKRNSPRVSEDEYVGLTHLAANSLLHEGKTAEAVDLIISEAKKKPSNEMYFVLQTVSVSAETLKDDQSGIKGMRWLEANSGEFGESLQFLSNLAHQEEVAGNIEESLRVRKLIVEKYPGEDDTASHILSIFRLLMEGKREDMAEAKPYLDELIDGDYKLEYRKAGQQALEALHRRMPVADPVILR